MKKILIVEDEIAYVKLLRTRLEFSYKVLDASNGKDGLKIAKKEHPDLILLDIIMPIMDGMAMLKELRKDHWGKDAKIILLTNLEAGDKIVTQISTDRPTYYFVKSDVKLDDLLDKINSLVPTN